MGKDQYSTYILRGLKEEEKYSKTSLEMVKNLKTTIVVIGSRNWRKL